MTRLAWVAVTIAALLIVALSVVATFGGLQQSQTIDRIRRDEQAIQSGRYQSCLDSNRKWAELHAFLKTVPVTPAQEANRERLLTVVSPLDCSSLVKGSP